MIMKHQRFVLGAIAIVGIGSAAAMLAVNFELVQIPSSDIERASWPTVVGYHQYHLEREPHEQ